MSQVYIYALVCPETGRVRYIGKADDTKARMRTHLRDSRNSKRPVCAWIRDLLERGLAPVMHVISEVAPSDWEQEEILQSAAHRELHPDLLNVAKGGSTPHMTKYQRAKNGVTSAKSRVKTPEQAELYKLKTEIGKNLAWLKKNSPDGYKRMADYIRPLTMKYPAYFGAWV